MIEYILLFNYNLKISIKNELESYQYTILILNSSATCFIFYAKSNFFFEI